MAKTTNYNKHKTHTFNSKFTLRHWLIMSSWNWSPWSVEPKSNATPTLCRVSLPRGGQYIEGPILMDNISIFWVILTMYWYGNIAHPINIDDILILIHFPLLDIANILTYNSNDIVSIYLHISLFFGFSFFFQGVFRFFLDLYLVQLISMVNICWFCVILSMFQYWNISHPKNIDNILISPTL